MQENRKGGKQMGAKNTATSEFFTHSTLIDFLYVDKHRVDSLISQIRNGTLRSVAKTMGASESSSFSAKGTVAVAAAGYEKSNKSNSSATEQYDPYHSQIIQLLNDLNVPPLVTLPDPCAGKLVMINAPMQVRDFATIKSILPVIAKNPRLLNIPRDSEVKRMLKLTLDLLQEMADSITINLTLNGEKITGTLKADGLSIKQDDLLRTYGVSLPDTWQTLGILDAIESPGTDPSVISSIEEFTDLISSTFKTLYSPSIYKIIPILIFRGIVY